LTGTTRGILCTIFLINLAAFTTSEKLSVYVTTDSESIQVGKKARAKELLDSAEDVRKEVEKRRVLVPASAIEDADIVVTILDRRIDVSQHRQNYGGADIQNHYQSRHLILYRTSVGRQSQDSEYFMEGSLVTWKRVASGLSKQVERWAQDNWEAILRSRELKP
jgi:hypothetical protein